MIWPFKKKKKEIDPIDEYWNNRLREVLNQLTEQVKSITQEIERRKKCGIRDWEKIRQE